jgi:hypothetical protein
MPHSFKIKVYADSFALFTPPATPEIQLKTGSTKSTLPRELKDVYSHYRKGERAFVKGVHFQLLPSRSQLSKCYREVSNSCVL